MKTAKLLFLSGLAYAILLFIVSGFFASQATSILPATGIPLIVITLILVQDLAKRSAKPVGERSPVSKSSMKGNPVNFFSGQIKVAANASESYFEDVIRSRLKDLLVTKVSAETGFDPLTIRQLLTKPKTGLALLKEDRLYAVLYGPIPQGPLARIEMINQTVDLIGAWKG